MSHSKISYVLLKKLCRPVKVAARLKTKQPRRIVGGPTRAARPTKKQTTIKKTKKKRKKNPPQPDPTPPPPPPAGDTPSGDTNPISGPTPADDGQMSTAHLS